MSRRERRARRRAGGAAAPAATWVQRLPVGGVLLGLLAVAILLVPLLRTIASEARADGYTALVEAAVRRGWLYPVPDAAGEAGTVDGRVEQASGTPDAFGRFINASFLRDDMATLDPSIWRYDGSRLAIDPRAHLISGAYEGSGGWRGSILYAERETEQRLLDERGGSILLAAPGRGTPARTRTVALNGTAQGEQPEVASEISFVATIDGAPTTIASLRRVDDHALLRVPRRDRSSVAVSIDGTDAAPRGTYEIGWHLLASGDTLAFAWPGGTSRFRFVQSQPAISHARGDAVRVRDPALESLARPLESAIGGGSRSLETSIERRVQDRAQQLLVERSLALYGTEGITSFRSAAVLMDGLTGEIAALPSFPVQVDHLHPSQRGSAAHRRLVERNSNFVRMVVGSTAKAPFALAILNAFPQLGQLRVPATSPFRTLLGIDLGVEIPDHGGGVFDFRSFLAQSSNKYAAMLMLLGLSDAESIARNICDGPSNERFWIGEQERNCRPRMTFMEGAERRPNGMVPLRAGRPAGQGWSGNLYTLFCLSPNGPDERPATPDLGCLPDEAERRAIWRGVEVARPRLLAAISPDREGFGLNVVDGLYEDYVMSILGGNRGSWSTISLAQTYARILTGRAITARMTPDESLEGEDQPEVVRLRVDEGAQAQVIQGLRAVVTEGTGRGLAAAGFPATIGGDELRIFAKTGTPNVAFLGDNMRALLQEFASSGCGLRLVQRRPRAGAQPRAELAVGADASVPTVRAIQDNAGCRERFGDRAEAVAGLIRTLNQNGAALAEVRADASGRVTEVPAQIRLGEGTGHVLVVMVGRYRPGAPDTQPCSLRVAAINFQARTGQNRTPAIGYAVGLLQSEATRAWFAGSACGQGQAQS